jgi:deaminated glutathione amidase
MRYERKVSSYLIPHTSSLTLTDFWSKVILLLCYNICFLFGETPTVNQPTIRVAAVQFGVTEDIQANLQTCLRLIDQAANADPAPALIVLPEFVNHIAWYKDAEHCYEVAVSLEDEFIQQIAQRAAQYGCYLKINVTLKRDGGKVTGTNILFDPQGQVVGLNDKQILMGNENNFLEPAQEIAPILPTNHGRVGMYACMDGVIPEVARALAVRHPQLLLNSLNSFAHDEASLHIPVRAAENKLFVIAANKVGSLVPENLRQSVAERLKIDPSFLEGAGESQIVAPDGTVLAKAPRHGEAVVWADIDLSQAENKVRPDGTDIFLSRRPELYLPLGQEPDDAPHPPAAEMVLGAVIQAETLAEGLAAIREGIAQGAKLLVLPELFPLPHGRVSPSDLATSTQTFAHLQSELHNLLATTPTDCAIAYTAVVAVGDGWEHHGLLLTRDGIQLRQAQLHATARHPWVTALGDGVAVADMAWGRVALVVGNDAIYPETFRLAAVQKVGVTAVSTTILEPWETSLGFPERAAENRQNLLVADRQQSGIYAITADFTLWTEWHNRPFDGNINVPVITPAHTTLTVAPIHPSASANRFVSHRTNVVDGRPWHLAQPLITPQ